MIRLRDYLNAYKILRSLDRADLYDAGLQLSDLGWGKFVQNPTSWLITEATDAQADQVWAAVEKREGRR